MFITAIPNRNSPPAILLREGYREDGKVKTRTLARRFSPASFVGNALAYYRTNNAITNLRRGYFSCDGVTFSGVEPGYTGNTVSIWAIKPA